MPRLPRWLRSKTLWRWVKVSLLAIVCLCLLLVYLALFHRPSPTLLSLSGSPTSLGQVHGDTCEWKISLLVTNYLRRMECAGDDAIAQARESAAETHLARLDERYAKEIQGLAEGAGQPLGAMAYANMFLDMGAVKAGCRSLITRTDEGRLLHAHNLDWNSLAGLGNWTVMIIRRQPDDDRLKTVTVGFPAQVGSMDVINEHGIALSFNQLGRGRSMPTEPVFISMRRVAETCETFEQARAEILALPEGMPFIITLSASASGQASIFERTHVEILERPLVGSWIAAANVGQASRQMESAVDQTIATCDLSGIDGLKAALRTPPVLSDNNLYSVIFDYSQNTLHLASGSMPAALGSYRTYELFEK